MNPLFLVSLLCLTIATSPAASTLAVDTSTGLAGLASGVTTGYEFEVAESEGIVVDGLGFWDDDADGFLFGQSFQVGLWNSNGTLLRNTVVTSTSSLMPSAHPEGDWRIN